MQSWIKVGAHCCCIRRGTWRCETTGEARPCPPRDVPLTVSDFEVDAETVWLEIEELGGAVLWDSRGFSPVVTEADDVAMFAQLSIPNRTEELV